MNLFHYLYFKNIKILFLSVTFLPNSYQGYISSSVEWSTVVSERIFFERVYVRINRIILYDNKTYEERGKGKIHFSVKIVKRYFYELFLFDHEYIQELVGNLSVRMVYGNVS